jgi:hypothetical protein
MTKVEHGEEQVDATRTITTQLLRFACQSHKHLPC